MDTQNDQTDAQEVQPPNPATDPQTAQIVDAGRTEMKEKADAVMNAEGPKPHTKLTAEEMLAIESPLQLLEVYKAELQEYESEIAELDKILACNNVEEIIGNGEKFLDFFTTRLITNIGRPNRNDYEELNERGPGDKYSEQLRTYQSIEQILAKGALPDNQNQGLKAFSTVVKYGHEKLDRLTKALCTVEKDLNNLFQPPYEDFEYYGTLLRVNAILDYSDFNNLCNSHIRKLTKNGKLHAIEVCRYTIWAREQQLEPGRYIDEDHKKQLTKELAEANSHLKELENGGGEFEKDILSALAGQGYTPESFIDAMDNYRPGPAGPTLTIGNVVLRNQKYNAFLDMMQRPIFTYLRKKGYGICKICA
jgi:hypothetical protein